MTHPYYKAKCLCIDIETARQDRAILREIGVYRPDTEARVKISGADKHLSTCLDELTEGAAFVLGHNIVAFDQPVLALLHPGLKLHRLPLVDTLELSPVAFPQNPYHRLVKDYKLHTNTRNDPARDAELAYELFLDQHTALAQRAQEAPDEVLCLHYFLSSENGKGAANFFATIRHALRPNLKETQTAWASATVDKACSAGNQTLLQECLPNPDWHKPLAYVLAWLRIAGGNSVLPPWVHLNFPRTREIIARLRDTPCQDPRCAWCRKKHDIRALLNTFFPAIKAFRPEPALPDGTSLQEAIVKNAFAGHSTLAILPTGGGKSLCYQLPALARHERNGSLTVIISPLQSLMKDQVDRLAEQGITSAGYLNGLLTPLERRAMLDKLRLGDLGLIFVAPEQFRSTAFVKALAYRQIGAWVFDEAHCLSKWGHDFRPDYLYVSRFIRNHQKENLSPVFCFTATAKPDVVEDIRQHFRESLGIEIEVLEGGVERKNLDYEVRYVPCPAKFAETLRLIREEEGSVIVFCARQKTVEELAGFLQEAGMDCGHFHGGMEAEAKRQVQESFLCGDLRVIAATNAFGMGVDKPDVRLVIHLDTPGSLENYLQEAGRAGRDQAASRCLLLYDEADLDVQFRLLKNSRLTQYEIQTILKALRSIERKDKGKDSVIVTSGEILLELPDKGALDPDARDVDTKARIAIAWLEEARLLERHENHTHVFPGSLLVGDMDEARRKLAEKLGANGDAAPYLRILELLMQAGEDEGVSTDDLALATGRAPREVHAMLRELDRFRLLSNDVEIGVRLYRDPDTPTRMENLARLENALIAQLRELAPDADEQDWQFLNVRMLCHALRVSTKIELMPETLTRLLKSFAESFGDTPGKRALFALRPMNVDNRKIKLLRNWRDIDDIRQKRQDLAKTLTNYFLEQHQGNNDLVTCKQGDLEAAMRTDVTLAGLEIRDWDTALRSALLYLDANEVLHLARGKAVFRAAMNIHLNPESRKRRFSKSDYAELALHYEDKKYQVHVMSEYAHLALQKIRQAMSFVKDYFGMETQAFIRRYFAGRADLLELATTEAAHRAILVELKNPEQQNIVATSQEENLLVLAGPGSGKTRVIVHRMAWLLREGMARPEEIMALAYNRSATQEIWKRLRQLVGADAAGVKVQTLHGFAMRLTGTSYAVAAENGEEIRFGQVIEQATALLKRMEGHENAAESEAAIGRDRLLAGLRYLLIDEYQDIEAAHYALISAIAGRALQNGADRLTLLAVGDDDQNIYAFNGANVCFIRQFENDYQAKRCLLLENYRSTRHIIEAANALIEKSRERMKAGQNLRINHARREEPPGGEFEQLDPVAKGRVHLLEVPAHPAAEAHIALAEYLRLNRLQTDGTGYWGRFAVIARQWGHLEVLAAQCREAGIPVRVLRDREHSPPLGKTREGHDLLRLLERTCLPFGRRRVLLRSGVLSRWFRRRYNRHVDMPISHPSLAALARFIMECESTLPEHAQTGHIGHIVADLIESLHDFDANGKNDAEDINAPMTLMTAHRAKGLEFDHVLILDGGGWREHGDEERRLFYVAMTRARKTLTICERIGQSHAFVRNLDNLALRSRPDVPLLADMPPVHKLWLATLENLWLSWPGRFAKNAPIHRALRALDHGASLTLQNREGRWELVNDEGIIVTRMSKQFAPPKGGIIAVRVHCILVRRAKKEETGVRVPSWELVLPEIEYL
jgi:ATP-dependent DNA helicase RecQ